MKLIFLLGTLASIVSIISGTVSNTGTGVKIVAPTTSIPTDTIDSDMTKNDPELTTVSPMTEVTQTVPDDYLNWFFHHSFNKLDEFFQKEDEKETRNSSGEDVTQANNWKVRVSKVILKLVLIILALVGSILFIVGVFLFMVMAFLVFKFLGHVFQCFQERQKYKNNSTTYQVNV